MIMFMLRNVGEVITKPFTQCGLDFLGFWDEAPIAGEVDEIGKNHFPLPFA